MNNTRSINKRTKKAWSIGGVVRSWLFKRIILNIAWLIINLIGLIVGAVLMSKYLPDWILLWYALVLFYGVSYRMISMIIFDALIGDGWS
tara:strand:+ start:737 stop:1006 length:270 start_codon:yes stop_codon:yes gene_type:complete